MLHRFIYGVIRRQFRFGLSRTIYNQGYNIASSQAKGFNQLCIRRLKFRCSDVKDLISFKLNDKMPNRKRAIEEDQPKSADSKDNDDGLEKNTRSEELDDLKPGEDFDNSIIDDLSESYSRARKGQKSVWLNYKTSCYIYLYRGGGEANSNLAAYDLDGTIIKPKSNKRIPRSATDWELFSVWTKVKLQQVLRENQARFVLFTNQNGVGLQIVPLEEVQERIELVTKRLDIPCIVLVAINKDRFRKPNTGMYELFTKSFNDAKCVDLETSFYCGDAVGYPSHSDADIKFAQRLSLPFLPPEKFLRGVKPKLVEDKKS